MTDIEVFSLLLSAAFCLFCKRLILIGISGKGEKTNSLEKPLVEIGKKDKNEIFISLR